MPNLVGSVAEECTAFVWRSASWIQSMGSYGNAWTWLGTAQKKGFATSNRPSVGSIVVYGRGNGYDPNAGHVAIVDEVFSNGSFRVSESNDPYGSGPRSSRVSTMSGVEGFILPPGGANPATSAAPTSGWNPMITSGQYHASLGQAFTGGSGVVGLTSGLATYFSQSTVWKTALIGGVAVGLIVFGLKYMGAPSPANIHIDMPKAVPE